MSFFIRQATLYDCDLISKLTREAFHDVADSLGISKENYPKHNAYCEPNWILEALNKNINYYLLETTTKTLGYLASKLIGNTMSLETIGVLPNYRKQGYGQLMMNHIETLSRRNNCKNLTLRVNDSRTQLKNWYIKQGFIENGEVNIPNFNFKVRLMYKNF